MLIQAAYQSRPTKAITPQEILHIQTAATTYNLQNDITSCLYIDDTTIFQVLEGETTQVTRLMNHIQHNPMHHDIKVLQVRDIKKRQFENWAFAHFGSRDAALLRVLESLQLNTFRNLPAPPRINILKIASARKFWAFNQKAFSATLTEIPTLSPLPLQHVAA